MFCTFNDILIKSLTDIVYHENAVTYANRHFKDVFSDASELSLQMQQLRMQTNEAQLENERLQKKLKTLENNKWIKFSNLDFFEKIKFLIKEIYKKTTKRK